MDSRKLERMLRHAARDPDRVVFHSYVIVDELEDASAGLSAVRTILTFMEKHPALDYGAPGPLVHFVERFFGAGYEDELLASLERRPTGHTVWMLQRLINGTKGARKRAPLITALKRAAQHPSADDDVKRCVELVLKS
jgi:hypothetical protein